MEALLNTFIENEDKTPYAFYINDQQITSNIHEIVTSQSLSTEAILVVKYQPLSLFRVRAVTRCTHTLPGQESALLYMHRTRPFKLRHRWMLWARAGVLVQALLSYVVKFAGFVLQNPLHWLVQTLSWMWVIQFFHSFIVL